MRTGLLVLVLVALAVLLAWGLVALIGAGPPG